MATIDVVGNWRYLVVGKNAPKGSRFKGKITTDALVNYTEYTGRNSSKEESKEALEKNESIALTHKEYVHLQNEHGNQYEFSSFFDYTSKRIGSTNTYSNIGWIDSLEKSRAFRKDIASSFKNEGDVAWAPVISLKDFDTAEEFKMLNENDYASVLEKVLPKFFKRAGFEPDNMIWWMDYHINTDNPHIHLTFLERNKTVQFEKMPMKHIDTFKTLFWNEVFSKARYFDKIGIDASDNFKVKDRLKSELISDATDNIYKKEDLQLSEMLKQLASSLPINGRLQYASQHMNPYRKEIDLVIERILETKDISIKLQSFKLLLSTYDEVRNESLGTGSTKLMDTELTSLKIRIGNAILKEIKEHRDMFLTANENKLTGAKELKELLDMNEEDTSNYTKQMEKENSFDGNSIVIKVASTLIKDADEDNYFVRLPGAKTYIYLSKDNFIFEKGKVKAFQINSDDHFKPYDETKKELNYIKGFKQDSIILNTDEVNANNIGYFFSKYKEEEIIKYTSKKYTDNFNGLESDFLKMGEGAFFVGYPQTEVETKGSYSICKLPGTKSYIRIPHQNVVAEVGNSNVYYVSSFDSFELVDRNDKVIDKVQKHIGGKDYPGITEINLKNVEQFFYTEKLNTNIDFKKQLDGFLGIKPYLANKPYMKNIQSKYSGYNSDYDWSKSTKSIKGQGFHYVHDVEEEVKKSIEEFYRGEEINYD